MHFQDSTQVRPPHCDNGAMSASMFPNQVKGSVSKEECRATNKSVLGKRTAVSMNYAGLTVRCVNVKM